MADTMTEEKDMAYSRALITILKGVVDKRTQPDIWNIIKDNQPRMEEYVAQIGLLLYVDDNAGYAYVKQNDAELAAAVGRELNDDESIFTAGQELLEELNADGVLVTRGEKGMVLLEKDGAIHDIPVSDKSEVFDVSGAGDTCVSTVILALAAGVEPARAAELSNIASGIAVRKLGTATVSSEELRRALR